METVRNYTTCPIDDIQGMRQAWTAQALCTDFIAVLRGTLPAHIRFTFAVQSLPPAATGKVVQA